MGHKSIDSVSFTTNNVVLIYRIKILMQHRDMNRVYDGDVTISERRSIF